MKLYGLFRYSYEWNNTFEDFIIVSDSTEKLEKHHVENYNDYLLIVSQSEHKQHEDKYETHYMIKEVEFI